MTPKLSKRKIKGKPYFSLNYSYRIGNNVKHIERGIGTAKPPREILEKMGFEFINEIVNERWKEDLDLIHHFYKLKLKNTPKNYLIKDFRSFGIKFTYESNKIEGSTLTLRDTHLLLEEGLTPQDKRISDVIETRNHMSVYESLLTADYPITNTTILDLHKRLFKNTQVSAGVYRDKAKNFLGKEGVNVEISGSEFKPPHFRNVPLYMNDLMKWYKRAQKTLHPVVIAGLYKLKFVSIHPFRDGNGRMSRLLMNYLLHQSKYPMLIIPYNKRRGYYSALEGAQTKRDNDFRWINWFMQQYIQYAKKILQIPKV
ncbi:MAG: Fic family protein [Promethearchaeota archaeon]